MQPQTTKTPAHKSQQNGINPFARALAEAEKPRATSQSTPSQPQLNPFSEALARAGGNMPPASIEDRQRWQEQQLADQEKKQKREALRKKLHDQINPVDMNAVYDAREREVKREIEALRQELKMLVRDVAKFEKEVEIAVMAEVAEPGLTGKYYLNFFRNLRSFIILLRQKIKSARTWSSQFHAKQKKKKRGGLRIDGAAHEQTKTVFDMMHHERSTVYSGD
ncbi:MAG: hypothetical protein H6773_03350 [Pseudomonadales bacterium]|nr:hypothetical protein [Pseudomonadales bacterium]